MTEPSLAVLGALADSTRWEILAALSVRAQSASALARDLPISRAAVLKHLAVLEDAELVGRHRVGREVRFEARPERVHETAARLERTARGWDARLRRLKALAEGS